jgi:hypothetical protein
MASHITFPAKKPSTIRLQRIKQIVYETKQTTDDIRTNLVSVFSLNLNIPRSIDNPYLWRRFPYAYHKHLNRIFFRLDIFLLGIEYDKAEKSRMALLQRHLVYHDSILDAIFEEARVAGDSDLITQDWRSTTLNSWLLIEYHVQRHSPEDVQRFMTESEGNCTLLEQDPLVLGVHTTIYSLRL